MPSREQLLDIIALQTEIVRQGFDLAAVLALVAEGAPALVGAEGGVIELADGKDLVYRAASGIVASHLGLRIPIEGSLAGLALRRNETLVCDDSETDPRVNREACREAGLRSMVVVPLRHRDRTVGVLKVASVRPGHFAASHGHALALVADAVGAAIHNATRASGDDLVQRATHDALTGLENRGAFYERLRNAADRLSHDASPFAVIMFDLDGLKRVNDTHGHGAGDALLVAFARRLLSCTRLTDTAARLGGDEFALLLQPLASPADADVVLQRLRAALDEPVRAGTLSVPLSASAGVSVAPVDARDAEALVEIADRRMYDEKRIRKAAAG